MPDREKVIERIHEAIDMGVCVDLFMDILALLKEQKEQKRAWLQSIADNQLSNSPMGHEDEGQLRYKSGLWNGLQMAYEIITAGEKKDG